MFLDDIFLKSSRKQKFLRLFIYLNCNEVHVETNESLRRGNFFFNLLFFEWKFNFEVESWWKIHCIRNRDKQIKLHGQKNVWQRELRFFGISGKKHTHNNWIIIFINIIFLKVLLLLTSFLLFSFWIIIHFFLSLSVICWSCCCSFLISV